MLSSDIVNLSMILWPWWTTLLVKVDGAGALSSIKIKVVALVLTTSMCYGELTIGSTTFYILKPQALGYIVPIVDFILGWLLIMLNFFFFDLCAVLCGHTMCIPWSYPLLFQTVRM